tara:strand:- start:37940 stop:39205 length:1266 start_codon:yes stop_codon:yes gene_type:complete
MALRLRRGTNAQRLLITPAEGELVYTTDTKRLYVGDGATAGGILVNTTSTSSVGELNDVDITTDTPATGDVLKWNGTQFVPAPDVGENLIDYVITPGADYQINIVAQDSTRMVDGDNNRLTGTLNGDVFGDIWDNISGDKIIEINGRQAKLDILTDNDVLILEHTTGNYYDPTGTILIDCGLRAFLGDVDGSLRGSMYDIDLNKIIDHVSKVATLDLKGSVFGDDSTLLVDGVSGAITASRYSAYNNLATFGTGAAASRSTIRVESTDEFSVVNLVRSSATDLTGIDTLNYGMLRFSKDDSTGALITGVITARENAILFASAADGDFANGSNYFTYKERKFGIGTISPSAELDVRGSVLATGSITPGAYADATARDTAIAAPAAGMIVFNTALQKFEGYVTDTGLAAGGASNATAGWVNLN